MHAVPRVTYLIVRTRTRLDREPRSRLANCAGGDFQNMVGGVPRGIRDARGPSVTWSCQNRRRSGLFHSAGKRTQQGEVWNGVPAQCGQISAGDRVSSSMAAMTLEIRRRCQTAARIMVTTMPAQTREVRSVADRRSDLSASSIENRWPISQIFGARRPIWIRRKQPSPMSGQTARRRSRRSRAAMHSRSSGMTSIPGPSDDARVSAASGSGIPSVSFIAANP